MGIHEDAARGTLTREKLSEYLQSDPTSLSISDPVTGWAVLGTAITSGSSDTVKLLIDKGARVEDIYQNGETPLLIAAWKAPGNRARIIQLLLEQITAGSDFVDKPCSLAELKNNTPLYLIVSKEPPIDYESVRLLSVAGADRSLDNTEGKSAASIARALEDWELNAALAPSTWEPMYERLMTTATTLMLWVVEVADKFTDGAVKNLYSGFSSDEKPVEKERIEKLNELQGPLRLRELPKTKKDMNKSLDDILSENGMQFFFGNKLEFVRELAENVARMRSDSKATIKSAAEIRKLIKVSLHQQVIYCDDSGSMRHPASKELSRWEAQAKLVQRIAQIGTRILPKGEGVALEFINHTLNNGFRMSAEETKNCISGITPAKGAGTNIGTNLRAKILEPLVYQKIERSSPEEMLERPLLVSVITDGQPAPEAENVLVDTIIECRQKLEMAGYPIESVKFVVGQVGTAEKARDFLCRLGRNQAVQDMVYVTSDQLDDMFIKFKDNEKHLDRWLLETLFGPFRYAIINSDDSSSGAGVGTEIVDDDDGDNDEDDGTGDED